MIRQDTVGEVTDRSSSSAEQTLKNVDEFCGEGGVVVLEIITPCPASALGVCVAAVLPE